MSKNTNDEPFSEVEYDSDRDQPIDRDYPDWNESTTFPVTGPYGPPGRGEGKGRKFKSAEEAYSYYEGRFGPPVEIHTSTGAGRYGGRYRLPKSGHPWRGVPWEPSADQVAHDLFRRGNG